MNRESLMQNGIINGSNSGEYYKRKFSRHEPSRVLHITNLPYDMTERDLKQLCSPFGDIRKVLLIKNKDEGLVEMETEFSSSSILDYFDVFDIYFRGNKLIFEYSNHQSLSSREPEDGLLPNTPVLNVKIDKMTCPVTLDVLYQIFSQHGQVQKIATYDKSGQFGALIQYLDPFQSAKARIALNGQNIYNNCCTLRIDFHTKADLHVSPNDPNSHDYTASTISKDKCIMNNTIIPNEKVKGLLSLNLNSLPNLAAASLLQNVMGLTNLAQHSMIPPLSSSFNNNNNNNSSFESSRNNDNNKRKRDSSGTRSSKNDPPTPVLLASNLSKEMSDPDRIFALFGAFGDVLKVKILYNKRDAALIQMMDERQAGMVLDYLNGSIVFGKEIRIASSKYNEISVISGPLDESDGEDGFGFGGRTGGGKRLLTKDYSDSNLHRYRKAGSKNYKNICHPSSVLHLSNIPSNLTEDDIRNIFSDASFKVERFKFLPNARNMALIRLSSEEEGIKALVLLNNYSTVGTSSKDNDPNLSGDNNNNNSRGSNNMDRRLRVSFSTSRL